MIGSDWVTSQRKFKVIVERDVKITTSDGIKLDCDIFRPDSGGKFPAILSASPYRKDQTEPIKVSAFSAPLHPHPGEEWSRGELEAGEPSFYVRRGYVRIIMNVRGSGKSEGLWDFQGEREIKDIYEAIEWVANSSWCDGSVGMLGTSYFAMVQLRVAALNPPHLKCIFAPWGSTDLYRDMCYTGGMLVTGFVSQWFSELIQQLSNIRPRNMALEEFGSVKYEQLLSALRENEDLKAVKMVADALAKPTEGLNPMVMTILMHPLLDDFWRVRRVAYENIKIPTFLGADWRPSGNHTFAAFRSWEMIQAPKRMVVGPPVYIDRPAYQLQYESLRWFDKWLKGVETRITDKPRIRLFVIGKNRWKDSDEWPLHETQWTQFYLHEGNLLSEHEFWTNEGSDSLFDSPYSRGSIEFTSSPMVEETEIIGPLAANIYASTTDTEILWALKFSRIDNEGKRAWLSSGWLRGSHRAIEVKKSKQWSPFHPHETNETLVPNKIFEFNIELIPVCALFKPGERFSLSVAGADYDKSTGGGRTIRRIHPSRITVYHDDERPSHILLPIVYGNVMGTFISGGKDVQHVT